MNSLADSSTQTNDALTKRYAAALPRGVSQTHGAFAARAENAEIWDVSGRRWIDFCAGIAVLNTGHRHPRVMAAVRAQLERFTHTCFQVIAYEPYVRLAERLNALAPGKTPKKAFFMNTGAEAVENAIKVARAHTGRAGVVAFNGAFHGRTMMTLALTGKIDPYKKGFGPFPGEVFHAPYPNSLHGITTEDALHGVELIFKNDIDPGRVAAIIVEPVQGEGGYLPAPTGFLQGLRTLCDEHGIVMIVDEVQTGIARCGKFFAVEYSAIEPDIITMAKGLGGGTTISAIVGKAAMMDAAGPGGFGSTYSGHPLAVAAALAVLDVIEEEKLAERATWLGEKCRTRLNDLRTKLSCIAEVRGLGAMTAIEFCHDGDPKKPARDIVDALKAESARHGLLLLSCGAYGNVLRLMLPLTIPEAVLDEGLDILEAALSVVV